ncbi:HD-GYP domain-containing protein [Anaeroselena agilis]|uniref:HD domain-containing protein n=1 Tax=Anaeroselena agilis TaxID=3063788 RepID=A0ABU3P1M4_9FIRM|nr:HD domain-containing protein [Selenomonadales bacterium 4137-cl]
MRSISLDEIQPGMYLSKPLLTTDGKVLLYEGIEIKERYIRYLRNQGLTSLVIGEPVAGTSGKALDDFYDAEHQKQAIGSAREKVRSFRVGRDINLDRVKNIVDDLIERLAHSPEEMIHLLDIRRKEEYIFSHAINTCILSVMTGLAMGYDAVRLNELGLAAILHDIGKIKFSRRLARQFPDRLIRGEREEYRRHPSYAAEILSENKNLSAAIVDACFQHHERWNGSGYPQGLAGDAISEYAQIISIADAYDRLIVGMPHRHPTPVYYAAAILNKAAGEYFAPSVVEKFIRNVAIYPMGKTVRLNNEQSGVILGVSMNNTATPIVRIVSSRDGSYTNQIVELDLRKNPDLFIVDFEDINIYVQAYATHAQIYHPLGRPAQ